MVNAKVYWEYGRATTDSTGAYAITVWRPATTIPLPADCSNCVLQFTPSFSVSDHEVTLSSASHPGSSLWSRLATDLLFTTTWVRDDGSQFSTSGGLNDLAIDDVIATAEAFSTPKTLRLHGANIQGAPVNIVVPPDAAPGSEFTIPSQEFDVDPPCWSTYAAPDPNVCGAQSSTDGDIFTTAPDLFSSTTWLTPDGDGVNDSTLLQSNPSFAPASWSLFIKSLETGAVLRTWTGSGRISQTWDGRNSDNEVVPDGVYAAAAVGDGIEPPPENIVVGGCTTSIYEWKHAADYARCVRGWVDQEIRAMLLEEGIPPATTSRRLTAVEESIIAYSSGPSKSATASLSTGKFYVHQSGMGIPETTQERELSTAPEGGGGGGTGAGRSPTPSEGLTLRDARHDQAAPEDDVEWVWNRFEYQTVSDISTTHWHRVYAQNFIVETPSGWRLGSIALTNDAAATGENLSRSPAGGWYTYSSGFRLGLSVSWQGLSVELPVDLSGGGSPRYKGKVDTKRNAHLAVHAWPVGGIEGSREWAAESWWQWPKDRGVGKMITSVDVDMQP